MEFTLKDLVYVSVYVATGVALITRDRSTLKRLGDSMESIKNIIFQDKGGLNIVDNAKCKEHRDVVHGSIRREAVVAKEAIDKLHALDLNIVRIMVHLEIEPITVASSKHND